MKTSEESVPVSTSEFYSSLINHYSQFSQGISNLPANAFLHCISHTCSCGKVYIGKTVRRRLEMRIKEHKDTCKKGAVEKSAVPDHT